MEPTTDPTAPALLVAPASKNQVSLELAMNSSVSLSPQSPTVAPKKQAPVVEIASVPPPPVTNQVSHITQTPSTAVPQPFPETERLQNQTVIPKPVSVVNLTVPTPTPAPVLLLPYPAQGALSSPLPTPAATPMTSVFPQPIATPPTPHVVPSIAAPVLPGTGAPHVILLPASANMMQVKWTEGSEAMMTNEDKVEEGGAPHASTPGESGAGLKEVAMESAPVPPQDP